MTPDEREALIDDILERLRVTVDVRIASAVREMVDRKLHEEIRHTIKQALEGHMSVYVNFAHDVTVPEKGPHD